MGGNVEHGWVCDLQAKCLGLFLSLCMAGGTGGSAQTCVLLPLLRAEGVKLLRTRA